MLECYERRKALVSVDKVQDHLELAEWCLRHHLYEQAALGLGRRGRHRFQHPRIGLLERRLKFELEQQAPAGRTPKRPKPSCRHRAIWIAWSKACRRDRRNLYRHDPADAAQSLFDGRLPWPAGNRLAAPAARADRQGSQPPRHPAKLVRGALGRRSGPSGRKPAAVGSHACRTGRPKAPSSPRREALQYQQLVHWVYCRFESAGTRRQFGGPGRAAHLAIGRPPACGNWPSAIAISQPNRPNQQRREPGTVRTGSQHLANQAPGRPKDESTDASPRRRKPANPCGRKSAAGSRKRSLRSAGLQRSLSESPGRVTRSATLRC